jgi:hypothetical protein
MRSPSIIPDYNVDVYLVLDDLGEIGRVYREVDESEADKGRLIRNLMDGQYNKPSRIACYNTAEGWARDVTEDIARELFNRVAAAAEPVSPSVRDFIERAADVTVPEYLVEG